MEYRTPEQRRKEAEIVYHAACIPQYRDAAQRLARFQKLAQRAEDNAKWHEQHLAYLTTGKRA